MSVIIGVFIILILVLIICVVRIKIFKRARNNARAAEESAAYAEVGEIMIAQKSEIADFKVDVNTCYNSLKQDPLYAEVEEVIHVERNDAYSLRPKRQNRHTADLLLPIARRCC